MLKFLNKRGLKIESRRITEIKNEDDIEIFGIENS